MRMSSKFNFTSCLFSIFWIASAVCAENVLVTTPRLMSNSCLFPNLVEATIKRDQKDDVTLSLKANKIVMVPHSVLRMSTDVITNKTKFERVEVPRKNQAYHSVKNEVSFVIECSIDKETKAPVYVLEGTFFVKNHKFRLTPTLDDVTVGSGDVTAKYVMEEVRGVKGSNKFDYQIKKNGVFDDLLKKRTAPPTPKNEHSNRTIAYRRKRAVTDYYLDILPIIDYRLYTKWLSVSDDNEAKALSSIGSYMANIFTSISLRIATLDLHDNVVLNIRMLDPLVSTDPASSSFTENNKYHITEDFHLVIIEQQLYDFEAWVASNDGLPYNDHTMLFSGYEFYGDSESWGVLGIAYVGQVCLQDGSSISITQDQMGYESELVAAHEFGHSLGSWHDGIESGNDCDSDDRYVMSVSVQNPNQDNLLNAFSFSSCSSDQIATKIRELEDTSFLWSCLKAESGNSLPEAPPKVVNAVDQCYTLYGNESYICTGEEFPALGDICATMFCNYTRFGTCVHVIPAAGTCCANGKYCLEGRCTTAPDGECLMDDECPFEDPPNCADRELSECLDGNVKYFCCYHCENITRTDSGSDEVPIVAIVVPTVVGTLVVSAVVGVVLYVKVFMPGAAVGPMNA